VITGYPQNAINDILAFNIFLKFADIVIIYYIDYGLTYFIKDLVRNDLKSRCLHDIIINLTTFGAVSIRFVATALIKVV
jgi:hypothetical protein